MQIRKRLVMTNAASVTIPILITVAASLVYILISSSTSDSGFRYQDIQKLAEIRIQLSGEGNSLFQKDPDLLLGKDYQTYLRLRFSSIHAELVVLKKQELVFSTREYRRIDVEKMLEAAGPDALNASIQLDESSYALRVFPLTFRDGDTGNAILLAPLGNAGMLSERLLIIVPVIFLLSFFLTHAVFSYSFSRSLLKPLSRLREAAGEISRGNLNHEVIEEGDLEIRALCNSFEQMRLKLKQSVYTQMKYDDNRKMLISSISHDLKTPIASIKGYMEGISDGVANTPEKMEKYLKTVYMKACSLDGMIDDLLLFSRLDLNQIPFHFEATDIAHYLEDCLSENEPELEKAGIRMTLENLLPTSRQVLLDRERMKRVLTNILDNARKYMDKAEGRISLILRESPSGVIVEIQDNGAGIAQEDLQFVFDRFYRADAARTQASGSGLGLAIARQIVEGHGGKIWARSEVGQGTRIMMTLPVIKP